MTPEQQAKRVEAAAQAEWEYAAQLRWDNLGGTLRKHLRMAMEAAFAAADEAVPVVSEAQLSRAIEKIEWLAPRCNNAEAAARDFAKVLHAFAAASTSTRPGHEHIAVFVAHEDEAALRDVLTRHPDYGGDVDA